jgi:hypothetical protein
MAKRIAEDAEVAEDRRGKDKRPESPVGCAPGLWKEQANRLVGLPLIFIDRI